MKFKTQTIDNVLYVKNDEKSIYLFGYENTIAVHLDKYFVYNLSFEEFYNLLKEKSTDIAALRHELTTKDGLINRLTAERETLEKENGALKDSIKEAMGKLEGKPKKINLGKIRIPEIYDKPYCLITSNNKYLCTDNTMHGALVLRGKERDKYYHASHKALMELLDKHYEYTLEK